MHLLYFLLGYLIGSLPTAFILVKIRSKTDIRKAGSGNVGGYNTYLITGSKGLAIIVGVIDGLKGLIAVVLALIFADGFWFVGASLLGAVVGHNHPVWLRFKGGRGLATAGGGIIIIGLAYAIFWCLLWIAVKSQGRAILTANLFAIIFAPVILFLIPSEVVSWGMTVSASVSDYRIFGVLLSLILIISHLNGLQEIKDDLKILGGSSKE